MEKDFIVKIEVYLEKIGFYKNKTPTILGYLHNTNIEYMIEKKFFNISSFPITWSTEKAELINKKGKEFVSQETRYAMIIYNKMANLLRKEGFKSYEINDNLIIARARKLEGESIDLDNYKPRLIERNSINNMILTSKDYEHALERFKASNNLIMINYLTKLNNVG